MSIDISQTGRSQGIGSALYDALEDQLKTAGMVNFLTCISLQNEPSSDSHAKRGYEQVAHVKGVDDKFDRWHDIIWMQKRVEG